MKLNIIIISFFALLFSACNHNKNSNDNAFEDVKPIVKITTIQHQTMQNNIEFRAVATYNKKNEITSPITGFIVKSNIITGSSALKNEVLFSLETQEQKILANSSQIDSSFKIQLIEVVAPDDGFINAVFHQNGDFVQAGTPLCSFTSFADNVFKTFVPYQFNQYIKIGMPCIILFSDGTTLKGSFSQKTNAIDSLSQNEIYYVNVPHKNNIPEGLNANVIITQNIIKDAQVLPKAAILSNETLDNFWIIKLLNDSLAIKVPITLGISDNDSVQILKPIFNEKDKIVFEGNYGLEDSSIVKMEAK